MVRVSRLGDRAISSEMDYWSFAASHRKDNALILFCVCKYIINPSYVFLNKNKQLIVIIIIKNDSKATLLFLQNQ